MRAILKQILQVAKTDSTVLIHGETGTGKELIAQSIHQHSRRKEKDFITLNCAAIPESLLENEFFGHEKGAFTGADARKLGKFEIAHNSTLFMDEIGDMPMETQTKVLRAIQENKFERLGGVKSIKVDVRFITATHQDLPSLVAQGTFRQDLFYRLNVFAIHLPPLRERREDIPLLVERFLERQDSTLSVTPETMQLLTAYDWPGNVRELENAIEAATIIAEDVIKPNHLPSAITNVFGKSIPKNLDKLSPVHEPGPQNTRPRKRHHHRRTDPGRGNSKKGCRPSEHQGTQSVASNQKIPYRCHVFQTTINVAWHLQLLLCFDFLKYFSCFDFFYASLLFENCCFLSCGFIYDIVKLT